MLLGKFRLGATWALLAGLMGLSLVIAASGHVRAAGYLMVFALVVGGVMRAVLPEEMIPALAVRSRLVDCLFFAIFAAAALVATLAVRL